MLLPVQLVAGSIETQHGAAPAVGWLVSSAVLLVVVVVAVLTYVGWTVSSAVIASIFFLY